MEGKEEDWVIGAAISTVRTILIFFLFGGQEYYVCLDTVPGGTPLIFSQKDLKNKSSNST